MQQNPEQVIGFYINQRLFTKITRIEEFIIDD